jgi:hypothetical protein
VKVINGQNDLGTVELCTIDTRHYLMEVLTSFRRIGRYVTGERRAHRLGRIPGRSRAWTCSGTRKPAQ